MKKLLITMLFLLTVVATITTLGSCKKYPNDKLIQLHSIDQRIVGLWTWSSNNAIKWKFNSDGTGIKYFNNNSSSFTYDFVNNNNDLSITTQGGSVINHSINQLSDNILDCGLDSQTNTIYNK